MLTPESEIIHVSSWAFNNAGSTLEDNEPYVMQELRNFPYPGHCTDPTSLDVLYIVATDDTPQLSKITVPFDLWGDRCETVDPEISIKNRDAFFNTQPPSNLSNKQAGMIVDILNRAKGEYFEKLPEQPPVGTIMILGMLAIYDYEQWTHRDFEFRPEPGVEFRETYGPSGEMEIGAQILAPRKILDAMYRADIPDGPIISSGNERHMFDISSLAIMFEAIKPDSHAHPIVAQNIKTTEH